ERRLDGADIRHDQVATTEVAFKPTGGVHHDKGTGSRIDNEVSQLSDSADQPLDKADRLDVGVDAAAGRLGRAVRDAMVPPGASRDRWLLQDQEVVAAPACPLAHARA